MICLNLFYVDEYFFTPIIKINKKNKITKNINMLNINMNKFTIKKCDRIDLNSSGHTHLFDKNLYFPASCEKIKKKE